MMIDVGRAERARAFFERTHHAVLTIDATTGEPLFAHHRLRSPRQDYVATWEAGCLIEWFDEPTSETRAAEETVRTRLLFDEIDHEIDQAPNPFLEPRNALELRDWLIANDPMLKKALFDPPQGLPSIIEPGPYKWPEDPPPIIWTPVS